MKPELNFVDALRQTLLDYEATFHEKGWANDDNERREVGLICLLPSDECYRFALFSPGMPLDNDPDIAAYHTGHAMAEHPTGTNMLLAKKMAVPGFHGTFMIAFGTAYDPADPLGFPPVRARIIRAVDINGVAYFLARLANRDPLLIDTSNAPMDGDLGLEALRLITLAVTRHLDEPARYADALMNLRFNLTVIPTCGSEIHSCGSS